MCCFLVLFVATCAFPASSMPKPQQWQGLEMNGCGDDMGTDGGRSNIGRIVAVAAVMRTIGRVRADARIIWGSSQGN